MQEDESSIRTLLSQDLTDVLIRMGLAVFLVVMCVQVFAPFANVMLWALILAVAIYPLHQGIAARLGGRQGRAATLLVVGGLLLIGTPTVMLGSSFASHVHGAYAAFEGNSITIAKPDAGVADWPLIGERVYAAWNSAADDLPAYLKENQAQLKNLSKRALAAAASTAGSVLLFLGALIVAGIMMAYGQSGSQALRRIFSRLTDPQRGPELQNLSTATIRSVALGVIGVAFIQALLLGLGFIMAGIPAAGVLAVVVMLIGIIQLPALLVSLPVIGYMWWAGDGSTTHNIVFSIYLLVAGTADNILKPLLLGRGVDAPMPVILIGALGGMVWGGFIGLFVGAVLLALGYQIFMQWVDRSDDAASSQEKTEAVTTQTTPASE